MSDVRCSVPDCNRPLVLLKDGGMVCPRIEHRTPMDLIDGTVIDWQPYDDVLVSILGEPHAVIADGTTYDENDPDHVIDPSRVMLLCSFTRDQAFTVALAFIGMIQPLSRAETRKLTRIVLRSLSRKRR